MKTARIETPVSRDDPSAVEVEEIPLPPEELWPELDNGRQPVPASATAAPAAPAREALRLDFLAPGEVYRTVRLKFPFRHDGRVIDAIDLTRLTTAQVSAFAERLQATGTDNIDYAAFMAGLPADVLRAMPAEDGLEVVKSALDFLPPLFQKAVGWEPQPAS